MNPIQHNRWMRPVVSAGILGLFMFAVATCAFARNQNPGIAPMTSKPHGLAYGEWSGVWWQWAYSFPDSINPVSDTNGTWAAMGQNFGSMWLLAGSWGKTVERTVTIPTGKSLLFPLANQFWVNLPDYGDNPWSPEQEAFARGLLAGLMDDIAAMSCEIDGYEVKDVAAYRFVTPPGKEYMLTLPENNLWGIPAGTYGPCVDDGYWLIVSPLKAGEHTIHIAANNAGGTWTLDVTYHLTVVGAPDIVPPSSVFEGKTLAQWLETYWRWFYGGEPASGKVGSVQLLPLPSSALMDGLGTPDDPALYRGTLELTLPKDTPFVLPAYAWVGERYVGYPAVPDDAAFPDQMLWDGVSPYLTIDGTTVISDANEKDFYVGYTAFDPIVNYATPTSYNSVAAVYFQGVGMVGGGLKPGTHVIRLYEPYIIPGYWGIIYDNTWVITVPK